MKELIKKYFEDKKDDKFFKSSVQYYLDSGNVSGSFYLMLKEMMAEYHEQQARQSAEPVFDDKKPLPRTKSEFETFLGHWTNRHTKSTSDFLAQYEGFVEDKGKDDE
jgi:hypothetical protein